MEELTGLQQGYYHLQQNAFAEAKKVFSEVLAENGSEARAYIGVLLAENGLQDERQLPQLPLPLADYELFARARAVSSKSYGETLDVYERQQEKVLSEKEEDYTALLSGLSANNRNEEALTALLGRSVGLKNYKDAPLLRERLEKELHDLRQDKKKKNKKTLTIVLCIAIPVLILLTVLGVLFAMPTADGVRYALTLNGYAVIGSDDSIREAEIPASIHGIAVTAVGDKAFKNCDHLKNVTLPEKIESIGRSAFSNCRNLEKVTGAENVKKVGEKAFKDCAELKELRFAEGCVFMENAFKDCAENLAVYAGDRSVDIEDLNVAEK